MRKSIFICSLLCSLTTFSCGTSSDEIHRITAENTQLKEANMALRSIRKVERRFFFRAEQILHDRDY